MRQCQWSTDSAARLYVRQRKQVHFLKKKTTLSPRWLIWSDTIIFLVGKRLISWYSNANTRRLALSRLSKTQTIQPNGFENPQSKNRDESGNSRMSISNSHVTDPCSSSPISSQFETQTVGPDNLKKPWRESSSSWRCQCQYEERI